MEATTEARSNGAGAMPGPVRPRSSYRMVLTGRLLEHAIEVFTKGCWGPRECRDCKALRAAAVLAERHHLPDRELDV